MEKELNNLVDNIVSHIEKAREEAIRKLIIANTIIIDEEIAMVNGIYFPYEIGGVKGYSQIKPMICGLNVIYKRNMAKEFGFNFAIFKQEEQKHKTSLSEYSTKELLDEIESRLDYVKER